jgi:hypothetical protein
MKAQYEHHAGDDGQRVPIMGTCRMMIIIMMILLLMMMAPFPLYAARLERLAKLCRAIRSRPIRVTIGAIR